MTKFNFSGFINNKLAYIIIIVILIILLVYTARIKSRETKGSGIPGRKYGDGNGESYYYGRGSKDDNVEDLLNRIDWSTYLNRRVTRWARIFMIVTIIVFMVIVLVMRKFPHPAMFIFLFLVVFIPIYATSQCDYIHGDVYNDYYIKHNVDLIREKLNFKARHPKKPTEKIPTRNTVTNPL